LDDQNPRAEHHEEVRYLETAQAYIEGPPGDPYAHEHEVRTRTRKSRPSRRSKTTKMRDTAIAILKVQTAPIRGADLQRKIEEATGFRIANMTTFMKTIEKTDENITKPGRGLYFYQSEEKKSEPILLGTNDSK